MAALAVLIFLVPQDGEPDGRPLAAIPTGHDVQVVALQGDVDATATLTDSALTGRVAVERSSMSNRFTTGPTMSSAP